MKKLMALLLVLCLTLSLCACGQNQEPEPTEPDAVESETPTGDESKTYNIWVCDKSAVHQYHRT